MGKLLGLDKEERIGWEEIGRILAGKPHQGNIFERLEEPPEWATEDINRVSLERLRHVGDIYLALLLWSKLCFAAFCRENSLAKPSTFCFTILLLHTLNAQPLAILIEFMQERGARYIVGTPKSMLRKFEQELFAKDWEAIRLRIEVKL